jgi:hypothetical protein
MECDVLSFQHCTWGTALWHCCAYVAHRRLARHVVPTLSIQGRRQITESGTGWDGSFPVNRYSSRLQGFIHGSQAQLSHILRPSELALASYSGPLSLELVAFPHLPCLSFLRALTLPTSSNPTCPQAGASGNLCLRSKASSNDAIEVGNPDHWTCSWVSVEVPFCTQRELTIWIDWTTEARSMRSSETFTSGGHMFLQLRHMYDRVNLSSSRQI